VAAVRLIVARCEVIYTGRLTALPDVATATVNRLTAYTG
jgi:hypothetical protein